MWKLWAFIFIYPHSELLDIVCSWSRCSIAMLILHSANTTCLPEIQEGSIKMRGSEWLWRAGEWQVLFEHVSKKSCWNANLMKQQGCLYWEVEIKRTASTSFVMNVMRRWAARLDETKIKNYHKSLTLPKVVYCLVRYLCFVSQPGIMSREQSYIHICRISLQGVI